MEKDTPKIRKNSRRENKKYLKNSWPIRDQLRRHLSRVIQLLLGIGETNEPDKGQANDKTHQSTYQK